MPLPDIRDTTPLIIGHRGFSARYPENTLVGFEAALDAGAVMVELDVTLTRDHQAVVVHDDTLNRTTDGSGPVSAVTLAELKKLDAGSWFDPRFRGEWVPTLEEALTLVTGRAMLNIEVKELPLDGLIPAGLLEKEVVEVVRRKGAGRRTLISSFSQAALELIRSLDPGLSLAFLTKDAGDISVERVCREMGAFSVHPWHRSLKKRLVDRFHTAGILVIPYTVNQPSDFQRLIRMGVDGVFTDNPELFLASDMKSSRL